MFRPQIGNTIYNRIGGGVISNFNLANAIHEWNMQNGSIVGTTMTIPDTGSIGTLPLANPTASQLPSFNTIDNKQAVLGDGIDDVISNNTGAFRNADHSGVFHVVFRTPNTFTTSYFYFSTNDGTVNNRLRFGVNSSGSLLGVVSAGGINNSRTGATVLSTNTNYIASIWSNGSLFTGYIGNILQWSASGGGVEWLGDLTAPTLDISSLGRLNYLPNYFPSNVAYICYTPYVDDLGVFADQLLIANNYGITV